MDNRTVQYGALRGIGQLGMGPGRSGPWRRETRVTGEREIGEAMGMAGRAVASHL